MREGFELLEDLALVAGDYFDRKMDAALDLAGE